jgi:hypothetical protein
MPSEFPGYHLEQLPDGQWALVNDLTGDVVLTDPFQPTIPGQAPEVTPNYPNISGDPINTPASAAGKQGGTAAWDQGALKWLASLVLLWLILTALTEYSPNAKVFGQALAGLILFGALFYLGPTAIKNVQNIWQTPAATSGG